MTPISIRHADVDVELSVAAEPIDETIRLRFDRGRSAGSSNSPGSA